MQARQFLKSGLIPARSRSSWEPVSGVRSLHQWKSHASRMLGSRVCKTYPSKRHNSSWSERGKYAESTTLVAFHQDIKVASVIWFSKNFARGAIDIDGI